MLNLEDIKKILNLRHRGYSYQAIRNDLGFSIGKIMSVCREEKATKTEDDNKHKDTQIQNQKTVVTHESTIQKLQEYTNGIDDLIKNGHLTEAEKRVWISRKQELVDLVRIEVTERLADELAKAIKIRDAKWQKDFAMNYVKKEEIIALQNAHQKESEQKDLMIQNLKKDNLDKDTLINKLYEGFSEINNSFHKEIEDLNNTISNLIAENQWLKNENFYLRSDIEKTKAEMQNQQTEIYTEQLDLLQTKLEFEEYKKKEQEELDCESLKVVNEKKEVETQKKYLIDWEKKLQKEQDDIYKERTQQYEQMSILLTAIKNRADTLTTQENHLTQQLQDLNLPQKKIFRDKISKATNTTLKT